MLVDHLLQAKKKKKIKKKKAGDSRYIYQNELHKACFQHDITYGDSKDLPVRTTSDKVLRDKTFNIAKIQNTTDIKEILLQWFIDVLVRNLLCFQIILLPVVLLKVKLCQTKN